MAAHASQTAHMMHPSQAVMSYFKESQKAVSTQSGIRLSANPFAPLSRDNPMTGAESSGQDVYPGGTSSVSSVCRAFPGVPLHGTMSERIGLMRVATSCWETQFHCVSKTFIHMRREHRMDPLIGCLYSLISSPFVIRCQSVILVKNRF